MGRGVIFLCLYPLMTCPTARPPPPVYPTACWDPPTATTCTLPPSPYFLDVQSHAHTNTRTHWSSPPFPFSVLTVAGQGGWGGGSRAASLLIPALLCNLHLRAFDNLEQSVQNLLQMLDRLLLGHVQSLM